LSLKEIKVRHEQVNRLAPIIRAKLELTALEGRQAHQDRAELIKMVENPLSWEKFDENEPEPGEYLAYTQTGRIEKIGWRGEGSRKIWNFGGVLYYAEFNYPNSKGRG
jgi:hypothetical protein